MQLSNAPVKLLLPFANAGAKNTIPTASQIGITAGAASLTDGFPPLTRTPIAAGGVPPSGLDMNGILYALSAALRWANAGGGYVYDGTFAADSNVGGYPKGARVLRSDGAGYWLNTIDGNTVDPESVTVNAAQVAGWVPDLTNGIAAITMTSANVTLTPAQYGKPIIVLSGVLTANLNLIFPNLAGEWTVVNNCTGAFTVTAKTAAGTGIAVASGGKSLIIWGNGANIYNAHGAGINPAQFDNSTFLATTAFLKAAGIQHSAPVIYSASGSLVASAVIGNLVLFYGNTGALSITLPASSACPDGGSICFRNASAYPVTLTRAGTDTINPGSAGVNSVVLQAGDSLDLSLHAGAWECWGGSAQLPYVSTFAAQKAGSGYAKLPSGVIIQWLQGSAGQNGSSANNIFPIAFPSACTHVAAIHIGVDPSVNVIVDSGNYGATQVGMKSTYVSGAVTCLIIAVGY